MYQKSKYFQYIRKKPSRFIGTVFICAIIKLMQTKNNPNYSNLSIFEIIKELSSNEKGLSEREARKRLLAFGPNKLPDQKPDGVVKIFIEQFKSPLIFILLLASIIVFFTGEIIDGCIILFVLFFNALVGTFEEGKSQNILLALKNFVQTKATVIRGGKEHIISDEELVRGDVIILREGEKVPADARIIFSNSLKADESSLTGESNPVHKKTETDNLIFKGTTIVSGTGQAIITATGPKTVIGNISGKLSKATDDLPLKKDIGRLSNIIILLVLTIGIIIFTLGTIKGFALKEIFTTIVAISVSVIPEGLPIVVTLVLATGVWRMSKKNVLVKKMQAVEALGQTKIIAVDKTGTLTKNELMVEELYIDGKIFQLNGFGYEPKGEIFLDKKILEPINHEALLLAGKIATLNSNVYLSFSKKEKKWNISGDPTEASILVLGEKIGFQKENLEKEMPKLDEAPFNYELKYHSALHSSEGNSFLSVVGNPESILNLSEKIWEKGEEKIFDEKKYCELEKIQNSMAKKGLRVVAFAYKNIDKQTKNIPDNISGLVFCGFFAIMDGLRENVEEAVEKVKSAGIKLVMITGDYPLTAKTIGEEAGIYQKGDAILTGQEIEKYSENELAEKIGSVSIFARVAPTHKLKIINAYKLNGSVTAMTGDGVNDALSLISADVGVAMGKIGTEVAKEASDIILLDDNFSSLVSGVEEGRNIFRSIKKVILYLFSTSAGELLTIIGALLINFPLPILPAQILWLNLVTDGFLDISLAMEPSGEKDTAQKSQPSNGYLIDKLMSQRIILMALPMAIGTLFIFSRFYVDNLAKAWTISLITLSVFQWFNAWNCRSKKKSIFQMNFFSNKFLFGATLIVITLNLLAIYTPFMQKILRTVPLNFSDWLIIILIASSIIWVEEIRKFFQRKYEKNRY